MVIRGFYYTKKYLQRLSTQAEKWTLIVVALKLAICLYSKKCLTLVYKIE